MAQTYKFGNGTWATKKGSTLAYSDTNNAFKPLPFNFTRNSIATRVNKEGLIEVVGNDIPRIDYTDSAEGALLLENSSTNLITYSEAFDNAYWAKSGNAVVNGNFTTSPDGKQNASKFTFDGTINATVNRTVSVTNGVAYTFSVWLKNNNLSDPTKVWIGLSTTTQGEYVTVTNVWQRFDTTHTSNGTLEYPRIQTSEVGSIFSWGAMLEQNSVASSYIPTNGSTVQRSAETCNESGNSEVFNDSQGVLFADTSSFVIDGSYRQISISNGSVSNYILIGLRNDTGNIYFDGSSCDTVITNTKNVNSFAKCAFKYELNNFSFWLNGFKVGVDTSASVPIGLNKLDFGIVGVNNFYGNTKEIGYYDEILTDAELEKLTSYRSLNEMVTELNLNAL